MSTYKTMMTELSVYRAELHPIFGETALKIRIEDEGGGMFIVLEQEIGKVMVDPDEWPHVRNAVERLLDEIKAHEVNND